MGDFDDIRDQVIRLCDPVQILLFGSRAKGTAGKGSDIDLCVVAATKNKRQLLTELYNSVEADLPIDFMLYTPEEWNESVCEIAPASLTKSVQRGCGYIADSR